MVIHYKNFLFALLLFTSYQYALTGNIFLKDGSKVLYNPEAHELVLDIRYDPKEVGSKNHEFVDRDYFNNGIAQNGKAITGPFQTLKKGKNKFVIWDGLRILDRGQLPNPVKFTSFKR